MCIGLKSNNPILSFPKPIGAAAPKPLPLYPADSGSRQRTPWVRELWALQWGFSRVHQLYYWCTVSRFWSDSEWICCRALFLFHYCAGLYPQQSRVSRHRHHMVQALEKLPFYCAGLFSSWYCGFALLSCFVFNLCQNICPGGVANTSISLQGDLCKILDWNEYRVQETQYSVNFRNLDLMLKSFWLGDSEDSSTSDAFSWVLALQLIESSTVSVMHLCQNNQRKRCRLGDT